MGDPFVFGMGIARTCVVNSEFLAAETFPNQARFCSRIAARSSWMNPPEFGTRVLEVIRQPLEDKVVTISRPKGF